MSQFLPPEPQEDDKRLEALLTLGDQSFKTLCEVAPLGIYQTDAAGRCLYTNPQWQEIYGLSLPESLGDNWATTLYPGDKEAVFAAWQASVHESRDFNMEFRILRGDGQIRYVRSQARAIRGEGGAIRGYVGAVQDVTERRVQDDRLRASEAFLDRTGRIAGVGGWQVDLVSGDILWSDQTCRIHGVPEGYRPTLQEAIAFYAPDARATMEAAVQRGIERAQSWDLELPFVSAQGLSKWVRAFGEVESEDGRPVRLVGAFQDVTEQKARQDALQNEQTLRQQIQAQAAQTAVLLLERTEMLDVLAHEVRQPLHNASAVLQSLEGLLHGHENPVAAGRLVKAQAMFSHVQASIDNTLAAATLLGSGTISQVGDTDMDAFLALTLADVPMPLRKRIQIDRRSTIRTVSMNMSLMRLALRNLLFNALSSAPDDTPVIVRLTDSDTPPAFFIDVQDQGPGFVDAQLLSRLFQRGARGPAPGKTGHGLGLYIVRRVMELHGGYAELQHNQPGQTCMRLALLQSTHD
jgi:PAS domain S-box-containing protein